jgi:hypothetical protein
LKELNMRASEEAKKQGWPKNPTKLSGMLRRLAPNLRDLGIEIAFDTPERRRILIKRTADTGVTDDRALSDPLV